MAIDIGGADANLTLDFKVLDTMNLPEYSESVATLEFYGFMLEVAQRIFAQYILHHRGLIRRRWTSIPINDEA